MLLEYKSNVVELCWRGYERQCGIRKKVVAKPVSRELNGRLDGGRGDVGVESVEEVENDEIPE